MAFKLLDGVSQVATGVGAGALNLGAATGQQFRTIQAAGMLDNDETRLRIQHASIPAQWEVCKVQLNGAQISRVWDYASMSPTGALTDFSAGDKVITSVVMANDLVARRTYERRTVAIASGVVTLDTLRGGYFSVPVNGNINTITLQNLLPGQAFQVEFIGNGTQYTQVWTPLIWVTGTPLLSYAAGKRDLVTIWTPDAVEVFAAMTAQYI